MRPEPDEEFRPLIAIHAGAARQKPESALFQEDSEVIPDSLITVSGLAGRYYSREDHHLETNIA
jgi:hypothetical protein